MTTDAKILSALRANPDGVSGAELAEQLGISRAAVWARIEELRRSVTKSRPARISATGWSVEPDALHADDLLARLGKTKVIGRDIHVFEQTTSTNDVIEKLARDGVKEGVVVFAESQTKGRGRLGRKWISPDAQGALVFHFAAAGFASAGNHAIDRRFGHGPAPRDPIRNRLAAGNQMAERHFDWREKSRGHSDRVERGTGPRQARHPRHRRGREPGRGEFPPELRKLATSLKIETGEAISRAGTGGGNFARTGSGLRADLRAASSPPSPTNGRRTARPSAKT